ncbi:MAG: hypothetical protein M1834_002977 [Cirrosporium novae-zelandiae]|nr:MAG: hypothetical protein M1834_002977 [Cirrosporium novae-zelandiae]
MDSPGGRIAELLDAMKNGPESNDPSRATSPGGGSRESNESGEDSRTKRRLRPRAYPYPKYLPYDVEDESTMQGNLDEIIKNLYIAIEAGDFARDAIHWTRELRSWLGLKFDPTIEQRVNLVKLYYELALAPGVDQSAAERFANMFMLLLKRKHYLRSFKDLTLDWRPIYKEIKFFVLPGNSGITQTPTLRRNIKTLCKLTIFAQMYFDPREIPAMLEEFLPYFSTSQTETAFVVVGLLNIFLPTMPAPPDDPKLQPQYYLPTLFHMWSLVNRSKMFDSTFMDLLSHLARDSVIAKHIPFSAYGIFTKEQSSLIFTAILRLLEIPVSQATSPYNVTVDLGAGLGVMLSRDPRKHPVPHHIARLVVNSLSPLCLDEEDSILSKLEALIQSVEGYFHPSNSGPWTRTLSELVYYLADFFVMRWNREKSGEMNTPDDRRLNEPLRKRFVLCLRDVIFMGIYSKSSTAMTFSLSTLQNLAYLEPNLILPGALQRIYPSMQGLVEVHRTASSLRSLQALSRIMTRTKGFRCHITTLLGLALPGIDANDLEKTLYTLSFIQSVCYCIPFKDLTEGDDEVHGNVVAMEWITSEVERMEEGGVDTPLNYQDDLTDKDEEMILKSSTSSFGVFLMSFLGRIFTLLENLPDPSRVRSGSPEETVVNTLPATFLPLLATLSPDLYDMALTKIADFVTSHVIHQARDAMAFLCNDLCKVNPEKALKRLVPLLIQGIRTEIDENGAASTRHASSDVLPRDRGLVWNISMLSMCVVHVGEAVLDHKKELFDIAVYMQQKCKGIPTIHISNYIHHLLLNLTSTYTTDFDLYEMDELARGLSAEDWGQAPGPNELSIEWHVPVRAEIEFAIELFESQAEGAIKHLTSLITGTSSVKRDGINKGWSDELSRNLVLFRLLLSGISILFDAKAVSRNSKWPGPQENGDIEMLEANGHPREMHDLPSELSPSDQDDEEIKPHFTYPTGYLLEEGDPLYEKVHEIREKIGHVLHKVHVCLTEQDEDEVSCFSPLYLAYRSWFTDVGYERSAHVLERVSRLLVADIHPFKVAGLRKDYPRPLLVRRANLYHLQRLRQNAYPRPRSELEERLLLDLLESSLSQYTDIRRNAQSAGEASLKVVVGARTLLIPPFIDALEEGVKSNNFPRIKGAIYSVLYGSLHKTLGRLWKETPRFIKAYIAASAVDKPSVQKLCNDSRFMLMEWCRPGERMTILDECVIQKIAPTENVKSRILKKKEAIMKKSSFSEAKKAELSEQLVEVVKSSHWRTASMVATISINLGLRFEHIASPGLIKLIVNGVIDPHPSLRRLYAPALIGLLTTTQLRVTCKHSYENYLLDNYQDLGKIEVPTERDNPEWTAQHLAAFARPETEYYVDHDHPGWLVWDKTMPAYVANVEKDLEYDEVEQNIRENLGKLLTRDWFKSYFQHLKQEPRDATADRFRTQNAIMLLYVFELVIQDVCVAKFDDIKVEVLEVYGDGSDKHQHRATAEIIGALLLSVCDIKIEQRTPVWEFCFPIVRQIFSDGLTPENVSYWTSFIRLLFQTRDPRRNWPLLDWLSSFRLDMNSNAAFKESSKIMLLNQCISEAAWHFRLEKPIVKDFLAHIDHPYKGVREIMGACLSQIFRSRYHEAYSDVGTLVEDQRSFASIGRPPYQPTQEFSEMITETFGRLEKWRHERTPGQQTPSSYTSGGKTVLVFLEFMLQSHVCVELTSFFPDLFTEQLLHMMDVKEDPELQGLAYSVFRHLANIPHQDGEDRRLIDKLILIGKTSAFWHQRLRIMVNIQIIYFRRLFLLSQEDKQKLFDCVSSMLEDSQHEVRVGAQATLSGMIRCTPNAQKKDIVERYKVKFTKILQANPLPKRPRRGISAPSSRTSTPTPEQSRLILVRHGAVLGLGALIQAFPYASPPPPWMPGVLITLSTKAANDPGIVGQSVKSIISDFKKTRQDTWHIDVKAFTPDEVEDLSGVLVKSYFA